MMKFPKHVPLTRTVLPEAAASILAWRSPPVSQFTESVAACAEGATITSDNASTRPNVETPIPRTVDVTPKPPSTEDEPGDDALFRGRLDQVDREAVVGHVRDRRPHR